MVSRAGGSPYTFCGGCRIDAAGAAIAIGDLACAIAVGVFGAVQRIGHIHGRFDVGACLNGTGGAHRGISVITAAGLGVEHQAVGTGAPGHNLLVLAVSPGMAVARIADVSIARPLLAQIIHRVAGGLRCH